MNAEAFREKGLSPMTEIVDLVGFDVTIQDNEEKEFDWGLRRIDMTTNP